MGGIRPATAACGGSPTFVQSAVLFNNNPGGGISINTSVPAEADDLLLVQLMVTNIGAPSDGLTGVTWDGTPLTFLYDTAVNGGGGGYLYTYYLVNPVAGANEPLDIVGAPTYTGDTYIVTATVYDNINTASPFGTYNTSTGNSGDYTDTITAAGTGSLITDLFYNAGGTTSFTLGAGQTQLFPGGGGDGGLYGSYLSPTTANTTYSLDYGTSYGNYWVGQSIELNAPVCSTPTDTPTATPSATPTATPSLTVTPTGTPAPATATPTPQSGLDYLSLTAAYPNPDPSRGAVWLPYVLTCPASVEIRIYDVAGETVRELATYQAAAGPNEEQWNGDNTFGLPVASGVYIAHITASAFGGSQDAWVKLAIAR